MGCSLVVGCSQFRKPEDLKPPDVGEELANISSRRLCTQAEYEVTLDEDRRERGQLILKTFFINEVCFFFRYKDL